MAEVKDAVDVTKVGWLMRVHGDLAAEAAGQTSVQGDLSAGAAK
jgi:hypothetical protein